MTVTAPNVILQGDPPAWPLEEERVRHIPEPGGVFKLQRGNRYEHFRSTGRTENVGGRELHIYEWSHSTYIAE